MRNLLLAAPLLLMPLTVVAKEPPAWQPFASAEGRFQILLPAEPVVTEKTRSSMMGKIHQMRLETRAGAIGASVELYDLPEVATSFMPDRVILERAGASLIDDVGGIQSLERRYLWNGHSAVELTYEVPGPTPQLERTRLILVDSRLYMVIATWPAPEDIPSQLVTFLESFELTPAAVSAGRDEP